MNLRFEDRIKLSKKRLLNTDDTYNDLYQKDASMSWPGDFVGRYSLALSSLYDGFDNKEDKEEVFKALKEVVDNRKGNVNSHFYFGKELNENAIDEQQMSGNSWYIRSLVAYYKITNDRDIYNEIEDIVENYLLKLASHYKHYPLTIREDGDVSGHQENKIVDGFILSSDVGCAFILLDGYVDAYSVTKNIILKESIENIIDIFTNIDYMALNFQTHATLTCSRAILRFYQLTNNKKYLDFVIKTFSNYQQFGMTLDYQNVNWFNKPDTWTEPCCVVDSFILARELYLITKNNHYLKLFNRIVTNGVRTFQRDNGGAGCSKVVLHKEDLYKNNMYEAWFCCSMRFGEGLKYLSESRLIEKDDNSYLIMNADKINEDGIYVDIDYYYNNKMHIKSDRSIKLAIYIPDGFNVIKSNIDYVIDNNLIKFETIENKEIEIEFELSLHKENSINFIGDMILSKKEKHIDKTYLIDNEIYSYIYSSANFTREEIERIEQKL